jgi:hypothetical protein
MRCSPGSSGAEAAPHLIHNRQVPLGPNNPEWVALCGALADLTKRTGAANAVVMDGFNDLWARAHVLSEPEQHQAFVLLEQVLASAQPRLERGGSVDVLNDGDGPLFIAQSFAAVYVLIVWFHQPFSGSWVRAIVRKALPRIESLTIRLPPPDGTSRSARAQRFKPPT